MCGHEVAKLYTLSHGNNSETLPLLPFDIVRHPYALSMGYSLACTGSGSPSEKIYLNQTLIDEWVPLVARGDVLLIDAWYNNSVNVFVKSVYETAAQRDPLPTH